MARVLLRRHAPEAHSRQTCSLCGARRRDDTKDHLLLGPPGTPIDDGVVCDGCGSALYQMVRRCGGKLIVTVEEAQLEAGDSEITLPDTNPGRCSKSLDCEPIAIGECTD